MHLSDTTLAYAEQVTRALLGIDALYRAESGDETGLAVLNMDVAGRYRGRDFSDYAEGRAGIEALRREAALLKEVDRRAYYDQLCHSTLAFIEWRTQGLTFSRQLSDFLHVPAGAATNAELDGLRGGLGELLGRLGYVGDLAAQCAAWEERHRVEPADVPEVLGGLLSEAWDRTERYLFPIPADRSDGMRVQAVQGVPYNARCDYLARTVQINVDPVLTRPGLKHLAVHEGCPGHYVQFKLRETWAADGSAPADGLLSVVNTASSASFEGIADVGLAMVDWVEGDDDRVQGLLNRYRAGIGTVAAWKLHAEGMGRDEVAAWLRSVNLVGGEGWVENRMEFVAAPSRAALIWSYWWGEPEVAAAWRAIPRRDRAAFLRFLHGRMHSNATLGLFAASRLEG